MKKDIDIKSYIPKGRANAIPRARLRYLTGLTDSKMRELIRQARHDVPILNLQTGEGYYIPDNKEEVRRYIKQEERRAKSIFANLKSARDYLDQLENQMYFADVVEERK